MKKIGIIANLGKPRAKDVLDRLAAKAGELGLELIADEDTAKMLDCGQSMPVGELVDAVEAIMALGGDGTMIRVVRALNGKDIPVMGVNLGSLGFMTSLAEEELEKALECLASDDFESSERAIADSCVMCDGNEVNTYRALNDVVIRNPGLRVVTLEVSVDGDVVTSYVCDGLIVSTPTGSTGHSLSAGGPILAPETKAFVISVICPHTLSTRPLVVPDNSAIVIKALESAGELTLTIDGQVGQPLKQGDSVHVRRSEKSVRFLHLPGHSYFRVLRQKLRWSGSNV